MTCNYDTPIGFDTKDLWVEHPELKGWYRHDGRAGDVTVLSNGEKTDNQQIGTFFVPLFPVITHHGGREKERKRADRVTESILLSTESHISRVIVFGSGRPQNGILLSPSSSKPVENREEYIDTIWPSIEYLNAIIPSHSRIVRELVLVETNDLPFVQTDKGTIKKEETLKKYAEIIDRAYIAAQESGAPFMPITFDDEAISSSLMMTVRTLLHIPEQSTISAEEDLFDHGTSLIES